MDCICQSSNWFMTETRRDGRKLQNYVVPTPEFIEIKDHVMATAELFSPIAWPMLIEPNDWSNDRQGGYLLNEVMLDSSGPEIRAALQVMSNVTEDAPLAFYCKAGKDRTGIVAALALQRCTAAPGVCAAE